MQCNLQIVLILWALTTRNIHDYLHKYPEPIFLNSQTPYVSTFSHRMSSIASAVHNSLCCVTAALADKKPRFLAVLVVSWEHLLYHPSCAKDSNNSLFWIGPRALDKVRNRSGYWDCARPSFVSQYMAGIQARISYFSAEKLCFYTPKGFLLCHMQCWTWNLRK